MRPLDLAALLCLTAALAGCGGEAFVDRHFSNLQSIEKPELPGAKGFVDVCHSDETPREERDTLAREACAAWGLESTLYRELPWQCRVAVPHLARYRCYDPRMTSSDGTPVNPFDVRAVNRWKREQASPGAAQ